MKQKEKKKGVILRIQGKVQGVGFRYYTQKQAETLGITGFVQNKPDGSVYVEAEGEESALEQFVRWCHKGPGWARVTDVKVQYTPPFCYNRFEIR